MAAIDTADDAEAAFIFAAATLVLSDAKVSQKLTELMARPEVAQALWMREGE
jgi:hypothetical protein